MILIREVNEPETLTYLNNRHYDPTTGVFISVDPLVTKTMQPYIYGAANPVRFSDPTGLDPETASTIRYRSYNYCVLTTDCSTTNLADSIDKTRNGYGGIVLAQLDTANEGWLGSADGNLSLQDFEAAAEGTNLDLLSAWLAGGDSNPSLAAFFKSLAQNAAVALIGDPAAWSAIDNDLSFFERNAEVIGAGSFVLSVASLGTCTVCTAAGVESLGISGAVTVDACIGGNSGGCAAGLATFALTGNAYATRGLAAAVGTSSGSGVFARLRNSTYATIQGAAYYQSAFAATVGGGFWAADLGGRLPR